jgi:hypothetical protein
MADATADVEVGRLRARQVDCEQRRATDIGPESNVSARCKINPGFHCQYY